MLSARAPISTHCKSLAYWNGLTRVRRLRRLKKIRAHCSDCFYSVAGSTISGLHPVENWRELVGPEIAAKVDAIDEVEWAVTSGPLPEPGYLSRQGLGQRLLRAPSPERNDAP
jgi:hypothetical protein